MKLLYLAQNSGNQHLHEFQHKSNRKTNDGIMLNKKCKSKITSIIYENIPTFGQELEGSTTKFKKVLLKTEGGKELKLRLTYLRSYKHY